MTLHVLVTGAGSGLGRALALRYARAGAAVACADLLIDRAEETRALIEAAGGRALAMPVDITREEDWLALRDAVFSSWNRLDVLINNAGVASGGNLLDTPLADWRWMLEVNLLGVVQGCQTFLPRMREQRSGHIVNVASFAGLAGAPGLASYGVAKAGVVALSEALRGEERAHGIKVSVACPTFFRTRLLENFRGPEGVRGTADRMMEAARETADDIADALYRGASSGSFMLIPTARERTRWRLKRYAPELYFRQLMKMIEARRKA